MKHVSSLLCAAILSISLMCGCTKTRNNNSSDAEGVTGTSMADGFEAYSSDNLKDWTSCGRVYQGASEGQWNQDCFWAPEVYERGGKYYMVTTLLVQSFQPDLEVSGILPGRILPGELYKVNATVTNRTDATISSFQLTYDVDGGESTFLRQKTL